MKQKQELKELLDRLKEWKSKRLMKDEGDEITDEVVIVLESLFDPAGDDFGSNPPGHGPGTPP